MKEHGEYGSDDDPDFREEFREFVAERALLKEKIGRIGGLRYSRRDAVVNAIFLLVLLLLLIHDLLRLQWIPFPLSLEIGVFLVSFKIIFMVHEAAKVNHFLFWILNTMEFRLKAIEKRMRELAKKIDDD